MANSAGRELVVKKNSTAIASVTVTTVTMQSTPIDITSKDDAGYATFLADVFASETCELSCEGYTDDDVFADIAFATSAAGRHLSDITLERPNGDVISGSFIMTAYNEAGDHDGAHEFTCTLVRNGQHTWTPA